MIFPSVYLNICHFNIILKSRISMDTYLLANLNHVFTRPLGLHFGARFEISAATHLL
jgi:hypothetical protein